MHWVLCSTTRLKVFRSLHSDPTSFLHKNSNDNYVFYSLHAYLAYFAKSCTAKHIFLLEKSVVLHLFEGPELRMHYRERIEKRKKPITWRDLNTQPLCYEACTLPQCYNRCPMLTTFKTALRCCYKLPLTERTICNRGFWLRPPGTGKQSQV